MTDSAQAQADIVVVPSVTTEMQFRTTDPLTGAELPAQQQLDMVLKNPNFRAEAQIVGSASHARLAELKGRAAAEAMGVTRVNVQETIAELRGHGQTDAQIAETLARFRLDAKDGAPQALASELAETSITATDIVVPWEGLPEDLNEDEVAAQQLFDSNLREWSVSVKAPPRLLNSFLRELNRELLAAPKDPDEREAYGAAGVAKVRAAWGSNYESNIAGVRRVLSELQVTHPESADVLKDVVNSIGQVMPMGLLLKIAQHRGFV